MRALGRLTLVRSLAIVVVTGGFLFLLTEVLSDYRNSQIAAGAYYFAALAGLTVLAGLSGRISLGQGAFMAVGAYTAMLLVTREGWSLAPALVAGAAAAAVVGLPLGIATTRLEGPYLAGATLAFAVGLPALADKFPGLLGGENGLTVLPPQPPSWLGSGFSLFRWEAWVACLGALIVLFLLYIGAIEQAEMDRTFNNGLGMIAIVSREDADHAMKLLARRKLPAYIVGEIRRGTRSAILK